jgi:predicted nucleic acid-binding protein
MTFLDTNVCLDLLAKRSPWHNDAEKIVAFHIRHSLELGISVISVPTLSFLLKKYHKEMDAARALEKMLVFINLLNVSRQMAETAINSSWDDLEDAMQHECALAHNALCIITRNKKNFFPPRIPVLTPDDCLDHFGK